MPERSEKPSLWQLGSDWLKAIGLVLPARTDYSHSYFDDNQRFSGSSAWRLEIRELFNLLPKQNGLLVDYGCGSGTGTRWIHENIFAGTVIGIDPYSMTDPLPDDAFSKPAGKSGLFFGRMPATGRIAIHSSSVDIVLMSHVLGHLPVPRVALEEARMILKPGGSLLVATPNATFKRLSVLTAFKRNYHPDPTVRRYYSPRRLNRLIKNTGFHVKGTRLSGPRPDVVPWMSSAPRWRARILIAATKEGSL